jgi:hypothetical protein
MIKKGADIDGPTKTGITPIVFLTRKGTAGYSIVPGITRSIRRGVSFADLMDSIAGTVQILSWRSLNYSRREHPAVVGSFVFPSRPRHAGSMGSPKHLVIQDLYRFNRKWLLGLMLSLTLVLSFCIRTTFQ